MKTTVTYLSIVSSTKVLAKQSLTTLTAKYKRVVRGSLVRICSHTVASRQEEHDRRTSTEVYQIQKFYISLHPLCEESLFFILTHWLTFELVY